MKKATKKKQYKKPVLTKYGEMKELTLKGGSQPDSLTNVNNQI